MKRADRTLAFLQRRAVATNVAHIAANEGITVKKIYRVLDRLVKRGLVTSPARGWYRSGSTS